MEPTTLLLVFSIPALIAGVALAVQNRLNQRSRVADLARERAKQRIVERAFADTKPETEHHDSVDFVTVNGVSVYEDGYNSHGVPLTQEQMHTIGLIFDGYALPAQHRLKNAIGPNVHIASGVPLNLSALDDNNIVDHANIEYLDPEYTWPESNIRHG